MTGYKQKARPWLSDCHLPRYPGIDDGLPITPPPPAATGVDQDVTASRGIVPSATPPGTPWNWVTIRLDHRCPIPPGITPRLKDCLRRCPPWNPLDIGRLSARIDVAPLVWYNARPPGFHLPRYCVGKIYSYHPILYVFIAENSFIPLGIVFKFREQLYHLVLWVLLK